MAAVVVGMVALNVVVLAGVVWWVARSVIADRQVGESSRPMLGNDLMVKLVERLLDASLPERQVQGASGVQGAQAGQHDAEYEPPADAWPGAQDWTDPWIAPERPLVARLAPGQGIPMPAEVAQGPLDAWRTRGEAAFDEWAMETGNTAGMQQPAAASWVQPIDLGDGHGEVE